MAEEEYVQILVTMALDLSADKQSHVDNKLSALKQCDEPIFWYHL